MHLSILCLVAGLLLPPATASPLYTRDILAKRATCTPKSGGSASVDDVPAIVAAIKSCGNGGIIVIPAGLTYQIRSPLELTGCKDCELQIEGILKMSEDLDYWNGVRDTFHVSGITGATITSVTGSGLIDGNGVEYWKAFAADSSYARPTLFSVDGASTGITVSNLRFKNPANVFHSVAGGATNILYENLRLDATSTGDATAKNTDGFDVGLSKYVTIRNVSITNQDDCIALKPGSDFAYVTQVTCKGSHGLSVGSLGGGKVGSVDTVTNAHLGPATMIDSTKAAGIKLYQGGSDHGTATVTNVTWSGITVQNCDYAIQIQSCYGAADTSSCTPNVDKVTGVIFDNFTGTTSTKYKGVVGNLNCSPSQDCGVVVTKFSVAAGSGTKQVLCSNIDGSLGVTCSGTASG